MKPGRIEQSNVSLKGTSSLHAFYAKCNATDLIPQFQSLRQQINQEKPHKRL